MAIDLRGFSSLAAAAEHSVQTIDRLIAGVAKLPTLVPEVIDVIVVGSYGRQEAAKGVSDFEWITIYDDRLAAREEAIVAQSDLAKYFATEFGRKFLSIGKTFGEVAALSALLKTVGGEEDSNRTLTYRMLTLAEGQTLTPSVHARVIGGLAQTFGQTHTAGHRLLSLATEIARYWRTLRIDYKFKVDESNKPWALRSIKLLSFRRFWYFSSALHFVAFGPRKASGDLLVGDVERFMSSMGGNPASRFLTALEHMGVKEELPRQLLQAYDDVHRLCSDPLVRQKLDVLHADAMEKEPVYTELRELTRCLHAVMAKIVLALPENHQLQMLEMFLL